VCRDILIVEIYVGSTTNFKTRKQLHKTICHNEKAKGYNIKLYQFIRNNGGWENWDMIEVHRQSCTDSLESHKIERKYIELLGATLNCHIPSMTKEEYYILNKDRITIISSAYRENNKEKISIRDKEYRENNKEKYAKYAKEYFVENKEKCTEYYKKYKESHLEEIKEQRNKRYICECGKELLYIGKSRHLKSNIHKII
jgi:hypothetical protein